MRGVRCTQHQLVMIQQVHQAGIAFHELDDQGNDTLQNLLQAHLAYHEPADFLEKAQLLLGALKAHLKLSGFRHHLYYRRVAAGGYPASSAIERNSTSVRTGLARMRCTESLSAPGGRSSVHPDITITFNGGWPTGRLWFLSVRTSAKPSSISGTRRSRM